MKKTIIFTLILIFLLVGILIAKMCKRPSNEMVVGFNDGVVSSPCLMFNFGEIWNETKDSVEFSFQLKNISGSLIHFDRIEPSCSCIHIHNAPNELQPDSCYVICGKMGIDNNKGHINKPIFITYNDNLLIFRVKGIIK